MWLKDIINANAHTLLQLKHELPLGKPQKKTNQQHDE